jgi:heptosyltransferase II
MPPAAISDPPRRLVIRGVNWLGDAVMTTPALLRLREALPSTHITLLSPDGMMDLWTHHPALDAVISFPKKAGLNTVARQLRRGDFDTALILPNSPRTALEAWLAAIRRRVGIAAPFRSFFLTDPMAPDPAVIRMRKRTPKEIRRCLTDGSTTTVYPGASHQMHHYLRLAAHLGASAEPIAPHLEVTEAEVEQACAKFFGGDRSRLRVGLNAGAEYGPAKRWPLERFAEAGREIHAQTGATLVLFGGPADTVMASDLASQLRALGVLESAILVLAGRTRLRELLAALHQCAVLLTNDTGPMHLAAAVGIPVVVPFGSTSPELTGPGLPGDPRHRRIRTDAPCAPCFLRECPVDFRCLRGIQASAVVREVLSVIVTRDARG